MKYKVLFWGERFLWSRDQEIISDSTTYFSMSSFLSKRKRNEKYELDNRSESGLGGLVRQNKEKEKDYGSITSLVNNEVKRHEALIHFNNEWPCIENSLHEPPCSPVYFLLETNFYPNFRFIDIFILVGASVHNNQGMLQSLWNIFTSFFFYFSLWVIKHRRSRFHWRYVEGRMILPHSSR